MQSGYPDDTMTNTRYTYQLDKISCVRDVWFAHITFAYLIVLSGVGCLVTRCVDKYKWMHIYFGRLYIIFMLWCMVTSLLVHNSGLPIAVLISFLWVIGGLTLGWIIIKLHQLQMEKRGPRGFPLGTAANHVGHGAILPPTSAPQRELRGGTPLGPGPGPVQ